MRLIAHIITIVFALTFPAQPAFGQNFVVPKGAATVEEVPEIFHGTWRITGSFHSYLYVAPEDFIGKTITITANGYRLGDITCTPKIIKEWQLLDFWYFDYSKQTDDVASYLKAPKHLRKNYTKVTQYSLKCPPPDDSFFSLATHHIILRHYEPSDSFITFLTVRGPAFTVEKISK